MNREGKAHQFECLTAAIADKESELAVLHYERDVVAAWLEGWDARQGAEAGRTADSIPASGTIYDANPANSNPEPAQAQAEAGLTADSGSGSANVSEGVTAVRGLAGETGGEAEGHMEPPDADDSPANPADIERDVLEMLSAIPVHCRQIYAALPYSRASIDMAMGELSLRHEIALIGDDGWALVSRQPQAEAAEVMNDIARYLYETGCPRHGTCEDTAL